MVIKMKIAGIDISKWQGDLNFTKVRDEGFDFAIIRAGSGTVADPMFETNYTKAKNSGMNVGAYWYTYAQNIAQAEAEAELCNNILKDKKFELPIYFDIEDSSVLGLGADIATSLVHAFCRRMESYSYFAGVYSSLSMFSSRLNDSELQRYAHWVACWSTTCSYPYPDSFGMWQYGGETNLIRSNQVAGKTVDQNYMLVDYPAMIKSKGLNGHTDLKYDVNGDGAVNSKDIIAEMKAIAAGKTDSEFDLNGDGKVNSKDTVSIMKNISGSVQSEERPSASIPNGQDYTEYTVVNGDTLSGIASKFGTTYQKIAEYNGLENPNLIFSGQILKIPK